MYALIFFVGLIVGFGLMIFINDDHHDDDDNTPRYFAF